MTNALLARVPHTLLLAAALVCAPFIAAGCGGADGGGGGGGSTPVTVLAPAVFVESGIVNEVGGGGLNTNVGVGDNAINVGIRGIVSFDITVIPPGASVVSATLWLNQYATTGSPYSLGSVVADHVSGVSFSGLTLGAGIGTVSSDATLGLKSIDVTAELIEDLGAPRTRSIFRLRFPTLTDLDLLQDTAWFTTGTSPSGLDSHIEVVYYP